MEAALKAQAEASPVVDAICFVGRVPHEEVENYYALTDVLAYPRKAQRLTELVTPLKPLEAMAQGRLVAASSVGGRSSNGPTMSSASCRATASPGRGTITRDRTIEPWNDPRIPCVCSPWI